MPQTRLAWAALVLAFLVVANIIHFFFFGWGLITVHVHDAPLAQVLKSVQRQGWVTIYTNLGAGSTVTMNVDHVPLAEAMETLAANVTNPDPSGSGRQSPVQWKLAYFAAPSSGQVQQEIREFQSSTTAPDATKIYSYPTPLQMLGTESGLPAADPRLQLFNGIKPPAPAPPPPSPADGNADANAPAAQAALPPAAPSTVQDYLDALAQGADIWIAAPTAWSSKVSAPPGTGTSITKAVKSVVSRANGSVQQAFVLYTRSGGQRGGGGGGRGFGGGGDTGWSNMEDRMRNAINGLPEDARGPALEQLTQEVAFQKQVRAAPADQRRQLMMAHRTDRFDAGFMRMSPDRRAKMYSRVVATRQSVRGK